MQGPPGAASTVPGPEGPEGQAGAASMVPGPRGFNGTNGINGTQGPPGPNQISPLSLYTVRGTSGVSGPNQTSSASSSAFCDIGDSVISWGGRAVPAGTANSTLNGIQTEPFLGNGGWFLAATGRFVDVQVVAYCFDNPPLRP